MNRIWREKRSVRIFAAVFAVIAAVLVIITVRENTLQSGILTACIVLSAAAVLCLLLRHPAGVPGILLNLIQTFGIPFAAMMMVQQFTLDPLRIYPQMMAVNALFVYLFYLLITALAGSLAWGYTISSVLLLFIGLVNYFVVSFRSSPVVPWDIYSLRTAFSVANNYTYAINWKCLLSICAFLFMIAFGSKNSWKIRGILFRVLAAVLCAAALGGAGYMLQKEEVQDALSMDTILFTPNVRYRNNGFFAAFIGDIHLIQVEEPEGYSPEAATQILGEVQEENIVSAEELGSMKKPNIIVIMNEAFSDLSVLGKLSVSEDYMPFMREKMKECGGGNLMVSVKGGNTANTEYEFLAGDTLAFLPEGSVVYQQFVHDNVPALPSYLARLGYMTTAIHPYLASGWDRDKVYELLGFRTFLARDSFVNPSTLRGYIDDKSAFDKIIEVFEDREDPQQSQFIFEVTMQNHGGYSKETGDFHEEIRLTDLTYSNTQTKAAEKYLTLIKKTDDALKELIGYFEKVDEPVIIVMFGDHQPSDYVTNVIAHLTGYDADASLKEYQKSYIVPYLIWNNYGLEMDRHPLLSVNYLAADILKAAALPLTRYQKFLLDLQKTLPVICAGTYVDSSGEYHSYDEKNSGYESLLKDYQIVQYNHLNDRKNRVTRIFAEPQRE